MAEHIEYQGSFSGSQIDTLLAKIQSSQVFTTEEKTKLASLINYDDTEVKEDISGIETSLNSHKSDKSNPHEVTKAQVGLGNVDNTSDANKPISTATQVALDNKVDKIDGKGLSTNDFTNEDKAQISANSASIAAVANRGSKNLLKIAATTQTVNGVTFTVNSDSTVTANGTNTGTGSATFMIVPNTQAILIPDGNYYLSGCPEGGSIDTFDLRWYQYSTGKSAYNMGGDTLVTKSGNTGKSNIAIVVKAGQTVDNVVFKPMLRDASIEDDTYQQYTPTNRELYEMILALQNA